MSRTQPIRFGPFLGFRQDAPPLFRLGMTVSAQMFETFTDRARRVVVLAQEEARMLNHNYIGTEHLLLGLSHEGQGVAAKTLESLGIGLEAVRQQVEEIIGPGSQPPSGHIPFTTRARQSLELARHESAGPGRNSTDTDHILLGLLGVPDSAAARILVNLGADPGRVRQHVIDLLRVDPGTEAAAAGEPSQLLARSGSREYAVDKAYGDALASIGERLSAIERLLGISRSRPGPYDGQIAQLGRAKEAAINSGDLEQAAALRDQEKRLIARNEANAREQERSGPDVGSALAEAARLGAEVARLQELLRAHGLNPGSDQGDPTPAD